MKEKGVNEKKAREQIQRWLNTNPGDRSLSSLEESVTRSHSYFKILAEEIERHRNNGETKG